LAEAIASHSESGELEAPDASVKEYNALIRDHNQNISEAEQVLDEIINALNAQPNP